MEDESGRIYEEKDKKETEVEEKEDPRKYNLAGRINGRLAFQIDEETPGANDAFKMLEEAGIEVMNPDTLSFYVPFSGHIGYINAILHAADIHTKKNHDYCEGEMGFETSPLLNFKESEKWGLKARDGIVVRMTDKLGRLKTFLKEKSLSVKEEGIFTILLDLANYLFLMFALEVERKRSLVKREDV